MAQREIPAELMAQIQRDRKSIEAELPELAARDARMKEAADETTVSAHLRRAIHKSRRPLTDISSEAGITIDNLCGFLEGERTLRSDVLDRLAQAVGATISVTAAK